MSSKAYAKKHLNTCIMAGRFGDIDAKLENENLKLELEKSRKQAMDLAETLMVKA